MNKACLILVLCMTFPILSLGDGQNPCGASDDVCQNQKAPILPAINLHVQIDGPEASALAPMPEDASLPTRGVPDRRMMSARSHDSELFSVPEKKDAITDPFGPDVSRPLQVSPSPE